MQVAVSLSPVRTQILSLAVIIGFAALTALSSKFQIYLWFTPVPVTLQSLVIGLAGAMMGSKRAAGSQIALVGLALMGLPVFAQPVPGYLVLMGPTGGYILGFILSAFATGALFERVAAGGVIRSFLLFFAGSLFIFLPGVIWLSVWTGQNLWAALMIGFVPFLIGDLVKCFAAAAIFQTWKNLSKKHPREMA